MTINTEKLQKEFFATKQLVFIDNFFKNNNTGTLGPNKAEAFTLLLKCEQIGFSFDNKLLNVISHASTKEMETFWQWMENVNKDIYKPSNYKPMYPNFPKQVIEAEKLELLVNAFMHYAGDFYGFRIMPEYKEKKRKPLNEQVNPIRVGTITEDNVVGYFTNHLKANSSLSPSAKTLLKTMFDYLSEKDKNTVENIISTTLIPQKENLAFVGNLVINSKIDFNTTLGEQFKTPTDLLRLCVAINDGDTSLGKPTKITKLSRAQRKMIASKLDTMLKTGDSEQFLENLFTYKEQWTRLAHAMHIGEYKEKYPLAFEALQKVRSNDKGEAFNYKVETLLNANNTVEASNLLKSRPGVFGRLLNQTLVRSSTKNEQVEVLKNFFSCATSIATPVLLQIHAKFKYDNQGNKKIILPKGGLGTIFVLEKENDKEKAPKNSIENALKTKYGAETLQKIKENSIKTQTEELPTSHVPDEIAQKITSSIEKVLIARFKNEPPLGKVYIDDALTLQHVPFAQRVAQKALKTVSKGSRFKKESDKPIIRFFTWWNENGTDKNGNPLHAGRVDIDLSVGVFDKNYKLIKQCTYYNLRSDDYLVHSGDITSAPKGAAEYVDVNIEKMKKALPEAAYVAQLISSYTLQKYCNLPECYAGWMEREQKQHGNIFEPSTVKNKIDITCETTQVLTCLYDIEKNEYVWADSPIKADISSYFHANNLETVKKSLSYTIEGLVEMKKPNLHDLFTMHAKARGTIVQNKEEADTIFSISEGITPYDYEIISAQFMADKAESPISTKKPKMC